MLFKTFSVYVEFNIIIKSEEAELKILQSSNMSPGEVKVFDFLQC